MDGLVRLQQLWSWLPAFRAVAEAQHLPTAAARLGVSAPALSRTIGLLEDRLGAHVFDRERGRLRLNDAGQSLLDSLHDAMRLVDDGWDRALLTERQGPVRIAVASGVIGDVLVPALKWLAHAHPGIAPELTRATAEVVPERLSEGSIDLALVEARPVDARLRVELATRISVHLYCGRASALWKVARPTREAVLAQPFVVPADRMADGWPVDLGRPVGVVCDSLPLAVELCAGGTWLAALPASVESLAGGAELRRLKTSIELTPIQLYVVSRRAVGVARARSLPGKIDLVRAALINRAIVVV